MHGGVQRHAIAAFLGGVDPGQQVVAQRGLGIHLDDGGFGGKGGGYSRDDGIVGDADEDFLPVHLQLVRGDQRRGDDGEIDDIVLVQQGAFVEGVLPVEEFVSVDALAGVKDGLAREERVDAGLVAGDLGHSCGSLFG